MSEADAQQLQAAYVDQRRAWVHDPANKLHPWPNRETR